MGVVRGVMVIGGHWDRGGGSGAWGHGDRGSGGGSGAWGHWDRGSGWEWCVGSLG